MFLINSRLGLFSVSTSQWIPFSLSYGVILPSSLTTLLPPAFGFSPHPPVSVYGTGTYKTIAAFLGSVDSWASLLIFSPYHVSVHLSGFAYSTHLYAYPGISIPRSHYPPASLQFCLYAVQEFLPVIHRLRLSSSP